MRFVRQHPGDIFKHHQDVSVLLKDKETLFTIIIYQMQMVLPISMIMI